MIAMRRTGLRVAPAVFMTTTPRFGFALILITAACGAASPGTRPADMTASQHLAAASEHSQQITGTRAHGGFIGGYPGWAYYGYRGFGYSYPWHYTWDPDEEHRALAAAHRDAAEQLKLQYETACAAVPRALEASSLLDAFVSGGSPLDRGVVFHLSEQAGPPELVLAQLRCHRAWLQLSPTAEAADSPLLVEGVTWTTHAPASAGVEVMATAKDERSAAELRRRAALVIERARKPAQSADRTR